MSDLWWLQPDWKDASCSQCGSNIWGSGGDPDWGLCSYCFSESIERQQQERDYEQEYLAT